MYPGGYIIGPEWLVELVVRKFSEPDNPLVVKIEGSYNYCKSANSSGKELKLVYIDDTSKLYINCSAMETLLSGAVSFTFLLLGVSVTVVSDPDDTVTVEIAE